MNIKTSKRKQRIQSASAYHVTYFMISTPTVSRLNNHVTVNLQSKVIIWACGKNKRAVLIPFI